MGEQKITLAVDHGELLAALQENTKAVVRLTNVMLDGRNGSTATADAEAEAERPADKPAAKKEEPKKEAEKPKGPTREDVVKALKDHAALEGKESAIAILKDFEADSVSDLDPDKYADVIKRASGEG